MRIWNLILKSKRLGKIRNEEELMKKRSWVGHMSRRKFLLRDVLKENGGRIAKRYKMQMFYDLKDE